MKFKEIKDRFFEVMTKQLLPGAAIGVVIAWLFCTGGIVLSAILISLAIPYILLLLLVLPAACNWVYEKTPAYRRKLERREKEMNDALMCINDLAELKENKTEENIARFKSKWPDYIQQITKNDLVCRIAYEKGVWERKFLDAIA